ncbi:uncharacterized protein [Antedon mediterranea]|uniref:uncharacterized protein isoform X2 n=1 Tax=Antedon mediterranea TaxID=105859 RepID=UPI003AF9FF39
MAGTTPLVPIINLANSIIGVGVLAMPWCFNKCGFILACCLLLFSAFLTYTSCMLLLRAAKATKRTSYENLAYHVLGATGKMAVELCIIGLLFCSCVSFFIIIGDLGPAIISKWLSLENTPKLRASLQMFLAVTVVFPLGLKRSVESLAAVSGLSMIFYICFTADMFFNSLYDLSIGTWTHESKLWDTKGGFICITITTIAFSCQTVLFTIYESMADRTIKKMQEVVKNSVTLVTTMYFVVGLCGYVTYYKQGIKGDVLLNFKPSLLSDIFQMGFTFSVALSFPLVIFPCRSSLYSMFYSQSMSHSIENPGGSGGSVYIPPGKFNTITMSIIALTLTLGILVKNVETVLALTGATLGSFICFILPAIIYIKTHGVANKGTAKFILVMGLSLTVIGLYHNLQATPNDDTAILEPNFENPQPQHFKEPVKFEVIDPGIKLPEDKIKDVHKEPPNPHPPIDVPVKQNEKPIENINPKDQPVVDNQKKEEQVVNKDENKIKDSQEKEEDMAENVIEQLKEKQVEQEKKIEAQAEEIELLKKQHDEEELERKEKEKQEILEKEERERKELEEKRQKEHEEAVKEVKEKEDAAIIEKAKEVIEQAAVLKAVLPQVGDQQLGIGAQQDNPAFGGLPQQPVQPIAPLDQLQGANAVAQGLLPLDQGVQPVGVGDTGGQGMQVGLGGPVGHGIQPGGAGLGGPMDLGVQPGVGLGGAMDPGVQPGVVGLGVHGGNQGGLGIQNVPLGGIDGPFNQGIQVDGLNQGVGQGQQPIGIGQPVAGVQAGGVGRQVEQVGAIQPDGLGNEGFQQLDVQPKMVLQEGDPAPQLGNIQVGLGAQPDAQFQNIPHLNPNLHEMAIDDQHNLKVPEVNANLQKVRDQPNLKFQKDPGLDPRANIAEFQGAAVNADEKLFDQQEHKDTGLDNVKERQERDVKNLESHVKIENDVKKNSAKKMQKVESKSKDGIIEQNQKSTLTFEKKGKAAAEYLQLELANDQRNKNENAGEPDIKENDVVLEKAVEDNNANAKNVKDIAEDGVEQKKKIEM